MRSQSQPIIRPDRLVQHSHAKRRQADEPQTSHRAKKVVFCYEPTTANPPPLKYRATTPQYSPIHANTDQVVDHRPGIRAFEHSILASWRRRIGVGFCVSNASSPPAPIRPCRGEARCRQWPFIRQVLLCNPRTWTSSSRPHLEQLGEQGRRPKANLSPRPVGNRVIQQIWVLRIQFLRRAKRCSIYLCMYVSKSVLYMSTSKYVRMNE